MKHIRRTRKSLAQCLPSADRQRFSTQSLAATTQNAYLCKALSFGRIEEEELTVFHRMPMNKEIHSYLSFLSFCLSDTRPVPSCVSSINWTKLLEFAKKQTVVGIFAERLLNDNEALLHDEGFLSNKPTDEDVMAWMSAKNMVTTLNKKVDEVAVWTAKNFKATGYDACILKGQGAALLYPHKAMRTPGDVDVWVRKTRENTAGKRRKTQGEIDSEIHDIIQYVHKIVPKAKACYHHIDFISPKGVSIEVHYRPQWLNNPWHNRRLQCFFQEMAEEQFTNYVHLSNSTKDTAVPTIDFNVVFMLAHLYNHLLHEGIGLRQLIDYYELLKRRQESGDTSKTDIAKTIDRLGLMPIAGAVMWLLKEFLGQEAECLIVPPNERLGKVVLREMVAGGNFGKYDERTLSGAYNSPFMKNIQRIVRDMRLAWYFPSECLWEPWFRVYHWWWRKQHQ